MASKISGGLRLKIREIELAHQPSMIITMYFCGGAEEMTIYDVIQKSMEEVKCYAIVNIITPFWRILILLFHWITDNCELIVSIIYTCSFFSSSMDYFISD